jgi:alpha-mannosidase
MLEFVTTVDWHASQQMLRVDFPVNVQATEANFEIQFGHVARPTHMNTSWDMARFETVGHKWADLSQPNYGVALMNDCKYGYRVQGNVMSLNLLRSPTRPDPKADRHQHQFRYGLYPHGGNHVTAEVVNRAYEFNVKPTSMSGLDNKKTKAPVAAPIVSISDPHVIVDTIKRAEDGNDIIVRLYEAAGIDSTIDIEFAPNIGQVFIADLMENCTKELTLRKQRLRLKTEPFEIITLALRSA